MKKHVYRLSLLCLLLSIGYFANAQTPQKVGINTEDPKETLDINGTVRIRELPVSGTTPPGGALYNGGTTKSGNFTGAKTVVADDQGNLGTVNFMFPANPADNSILIWNGQNWVAVPATDIGKIYTGSASIFLNTTNNSFEREALTGDVTAQKDRNETTVVKIQGKAVASTPPQNGQVLKWNGTQWEPAADNNTNTTYTQSPSIKIESNNQIVREALQGDVTAAKNSNQTTVVKIQGKAVANTQPTNDQVLTWEGDATNGKWKPKNSINDGAWLKKNTAPNHAIATKADNIAGNSIYYKGKVGIGDFSTGNRPDIELQSGNAGEAQLSIIGGGKNQLRLFNKGVDGTPYKTAFDISTESGGLTFIDRSESTEWRTAYFHKNGSVIFAGHIAGPTNSNGRNRTGIYTINGGKSFHYDSRNGRIGIAIQGEPTQTIDAGGTARLRGMPNIEATVNGNFAVYAGASGVLKKGAIPKLAISGVNNMSTNTDGLLSFTGVENFSYDFKNLSPWRLQATDRGAVGKHDKMYHDGNIGIGNFSTTGSNLADARIWISTGRNSNVSHLRLLKTLSLDDPSWDIRTETEGLAILSSQRSTTGKIFFQNNGSLIAGSSLRDNNDHSKFFFDASTNKLGIGITGTGTEGNPTQSIDVSGTARLRGIQKNAVEADLLPVYVDSNGVLKKGDRITGGGSPWYKDSSTPATKDDLSNKIFHNGTVGIGGDFAATPEGLSSLTDTTIETVKLSVQGAVLAGSYKGKNGARIFPDYVFQKYYTGTSSYANYQFRSLNQVEKFVKEKGHLPGYLSAKTIKEQGYIDLMKTQITNVEKIEELYLHTIEQEKAIKEKDAKIKELESRLERLEKLLIK